MLEAPAATRIPPEVLTVPPPRPATRTVAIVFLCVAAGLLVLATFLLWFIPDPKARWIVFGVIGGNGLVFAIIAACMLPVGIRQDRQRRQLIVDLAARHGENSVAAEISRAIADRRHHRFRRRLSQLNRRLPPASPPRARLVCVGDYRLPEPGCYLFEPEVITPTRYLGRYWIPVAIGVIVLVFMLLRITGAVRWLSFIPIGAIGSFGYFYVMAIVFGGLWLWRTTIRPTYLRLAPGVIQVLRFPFRRGKPKVSSFPMEDGTLAMIYCTPHFREMRPAMLILVRGDECESIHVAQLLRSPELIERFWHALLSTSPIPQMSDEELLG
jgi:hypothetical protein